MLNNLDMQAIRVGCFTEHFNQTSWRQVWVKGEEKKDSVSPNLKYLHILYPEKRR